jgi:hypothetical protein
MCCRSEWRDRQEIRNRRRFIGDAPGFIGHAASPAPSALRNCGRQQAQVGSQVALLLGEP